MKLFRLIYQDDRNISSYQRVQRGGNFANVQLRQRGGNPASQQHSPQGFDINLETGDLELAPIDLREERNRRRLMNVNRKTKNGVSE